MIDSATGKGTAMTDLHDTTTTRRTTGEQAKAQLLADLTLIERRLELAGVSTAVLEGGDGPAGHVPQRSVRVRQVVRVQPEASLRALHVALGRTVTRRQS